jgi:ATP/maltotriose-dependent transcriptional regulator MalT
VIQNKILPPVPSRGIVMRERLVNILRENIEKNLILIFSPAGYGKTTLIQSFLSTQKCDYAWLNASSEMDHIYTFFQYLVHSLKHIDAGFGDNTLEMLDSRRERNQLGHNKAKAVIDDFVNLFINEFNNTFSKDVILVIDDFQHIEESKWIKETFNTLFAGMPRKLHLVIISRQIPDFDFIPMIVKGNMLKIGMEDLIFRFDEIINLLENIYSFEYSDNGIKLLENNLGGWITGIHLTLQSYGKDFNNIKLDYQKIPENIFNFLANEIFEHLDSEMQNFLLATSLLENFNEDICNQALGIRNSGELISKLIAKNLFIQTIAVDQGIKNVLVYNYQILFKKFLASKLYEVNTRENVKVMMKKVFDYYKEHGDIISAINYLVMARDYDTVIPVIIENFSNLFNEGKFEFLWKWLTSIKDEIVLHNPYLIYFIGVLYKYYIGDLETSLDYLKKALNKFTEKDGAEHIIKCHVNISSVLLNLGKTQEAILELNGLLKSLNNEEYKAPVLYFLATAYYQNSEYDTAEQMLKEALEICCSENLMKVKMDILNMLGHIELIKGEYRKSAEYYERVLEGKPNVLHRFETLCNLILILSQSSKYKKAAEHLNQLNEFIGRFDTPILRIPYLLAKQAYYYESGNFEENIRILHEINTTAQAMNHKKYIYLSYRLLIDSYYYMNNIPKACEYYELSCKCLDDKNELEKMEIKATQAVLKKTKNIDKGIENALLEAYEFYGTNDILLNKIGICYNLADYYMRAGDLKNAKKYLEECLKISSEKEYLSYLYRESLYGSELLDFAIQNNIHIDFVKEIKNIQPISKEIVNETDKAGF